MANFLFFDLETTGLLKAKKNEINFTKSEQFPEIVQISWQLYSFEKNKFSHLDTKNYIIKPDGYTIPEESSKIHGITNEQALKEGVEKKDVLEDFVATMMVNPKTYLVCHNIEFDVTVLFYHLYRQFKSVFNHNIDKKVACICTMLDTIELCQIPTKNPLKYPKKNPTPNDLYKYPRLSELYVTLFKKEPEGRLHDSSFDVECLVECFKKLVKMKHSINVRYASFLVE